jgi:hypothetical protein
MVAAIAEYHDWKSQGNLQKNHDRLQLMSKHPAAGAAR